MNIAINKICKQYGNFTALSDVSLNISRGELVAFLGPSGSGKTTLLRILAGLDTPDSGTIRVNGMDISHKRPGERRVGFVFQHYALFQHLTVFENVAFGLRVRPRKFRPSYNVIRDKVSTLLKLVQLEHFSNRYPAQLSGGQCQRVALARALAVEPGILLLDEPFGALDAKVRKELRRWLRRLHTEMNVTSIFVTHDQEEALEVADRLVIINNGKLEQVGPPHQVYHHPANAFVCNFIGDVNFFHCRMEAEASAPGSPLSDCPAAVAVTKKVFARPQAITLHLNDPGPGSIRGQVKNINPAGPFVKVELENELGEPLSACITHECLQKLNLTSSLQVYIQPQKWYEFKETT